MPQGISDEKRQSIIESLKNLGDDEKQKKIAEEEGVSEATVSNVKQSWKAGKEEGKNEKAENLADTIADNLSFDDNDETEDNTDSDVYTCAYCEKETGKKVQVEYLDNKCPNGHDLSGDW